MSYTPRTDLMVERAPIGLRTNAAFEQSCDLCRQLERELNAANERINRLEEALECTVIHCDYLHCRKNHQHKLGEPCPVEQLVRKAMEAKP